MFYSQGTGGLYKRSRTEQGHFWRKLGWQTKVQWMLHKDMATQRYGKKQLWRRKSMLVNEKHLAT